jgi:hypothetical protein
MDSLSNRTHKSDSLPNFGVNRTGVDEDGRFFDLGREGATPASMAAAARPSSSPPAPRPPLSPPAPCPSSSPRLPSSPPTPRTPSCLLTLQHEGSSSSRSPSSQEDDTQGAAGRSPSPDTTGTPCLLLALQSTCVGWGASSTPTGDGAKERVRRWGADARVLHEVRWGGGDAGATSSGRHGGISSWGRRPHLRRPPLPPQLLARQRCFSPRAGRRHAPHLATPSPSPFLLPARNANGLSWAPPLVLSRESLPLLDLKEIGWGGGRRDFEGSLEETAAADKTLSDG